MADKRDPFIDYLRGIAIVWVVMAHVLYFKSFFPYPLFQSYLLFEMPTIFFVSGASLYYSIAKMRSVSGFLIQRTVRLLKPYYLLAAVGVALHYLTAMARGGPLSIEHAVRWLVLRPTETTPRYIEFYLWFVLIAVAVSFLHPLLGRLYLNRTARHWTLIALAAGIVLESYHFFQPLFDFIWSILPEYWARIVSDTIWYSVFYSLFMYLGYYYSDGRLNFRPAVYAASASVTVGLLALTIGLGQFSVYMNINKFPPNIAYALLGSAWISVFLLIRPGMNRFFKRVPRLRRFIGYCGQHSYSIYLWHGFGFWLLDSLLRWSHTEARVISTFYAVPLLLYFGVVLLFSYYVSKAVDRLVPA